MKLKDERMGYIEPLITILQFLIYIGLFVLCAILLFFTVVYFFSDKGEMDYVVVVKTIFVVSIFFPLAYITIQLLQSVLIERPFIKENVKRIQIMGLIILGINSLKILLTLTHSILNLETIPIINEFVEPKVFGLSGIMYGGLVLVISEVFRIGVKLKEENELTV